MKDLSVSTVVLGHIHSNCYVVENDTSFVVIDPGFKSENVENYVKSLIKGGKIGAVLLTHCHFDHISGANEFRVMGLRIMASAIDGRTIANNDYNLSTRFHFNVEPVIVDELFEDECIVKIGDLMVEVIFTPGHTAGGVCYKIGNMLFSGDTLFKGSFGRTDCPGGDIKVEQQSCFKLFELESDIIVYPGHGTRTTIGVEKNTNPILDIEEYI